jgi:Holliday junction resolvase RusA-like endonuclease
VELVIPGEPMGQERARHARRGKFVTTYDPPKSRNWKATARQFMCDAMAGAPPLQGPVALSIAATFTLARSHWRKRQPVPRQWHTSTPDADNVAKIVKDAAKGVLWLDDCQVVSLHAIKVLGAQGEAPCLWIKVEPVMVQP